MPDQKAKAGKSAPDPRDTTNLVPFNCGETSLLAEGPHAKGICALACNLWGCDNCGPTKLAGLRALIRGGKPTMMLTLTERPDSRVSRERQAKRQTEAWKKLYARMLRYAGVKSIPYIWHREATKQGTSHLHILMRLVEPFKKTWLSDQWKELTGSFKVELTPITDEGGIAAYVSKHTAKEPTKFGNCKRWFATRDWDLRQDQAPEPWPDVGALYLLVQEKASALIHKWLCQGYRADYSHPRVVVMARGPP